MILVNISMVCNHCKNLLEETYRFAILLRVFSILLQLPRCIAIKYGDLCFQGRKLLSFYLHTLQNVVPLLLIAPSFPFFRLNGTGISNINCERTRARNQRQLATFDISIFKHCSEAFGSKLQIFQVPFVPQFP